MSATAVPTKPWRPTRAEVTRNGLMATLVLFGTWAIIEFTGVAGKLGAFVSAAILAVIVSSISAGLARVNMRQRTRRRVPSLRSAGSLPYFP